MIVAQIVRPELHHKGTVRKWELWGGGSPIEQLQHKQIREFLDWVHERALAEEGATFPLRAPRVTAPVIRGSSMCRCTTSSIRRSRSDETPTSSGFTRGGSCCDNDGVAATRPRRVRIGIGRSQAAEPPRAANGDLRTVYLS